MYVTLTTREREAEQDGDDVVCCHRVEPFKIKCDGCLRIQAAIDTGKTDLLVVALVERRRQAERDKKEARHLAIQARLRAERAERKARRRISRANGARPKNKRRKIVPLDVIERLMKMTRQKAIAKADAKYNITLSELDQMVVAQRGKCAICRHGGTKLLVDHCHACGEVRGLLDTACNNRVGRVEAKMILYRRAINYIRRTTLCRYGKKNTSQLPLPLAA
jgi:hypothetical protein